MEIKNHLLTFHAPPPPLTHPRLSPTHALAHIPSTTFPRTRTRTPLRFSGYGGNQQFVYEARDSTIRHDGARGCLETSGAGGVPQVGNCHDPKPESQQWDWVHPDDVPADRLY